MRHIPRTCVCKDAISRHHPDSWDVCLEEDEGRGDAQCRWSQCGETQAWDKALPAAQAQTKFTLLRMQGQRHFQALTVLDHLQPAHFVLE